MNISVDDLGPCKKLVRIEFDQESVKEASNTVVDKYQKQAQLPGFRKGKAPKLMIISSYRDDIEQQVKSTLMEKGLKKAIEDNEFRLINYNDIEIIKFDLNGEFSVSANIEVEPSFDVPEYKGLEVEAVRITVTDEDVNEALETLRAQKAEYVDADGPLTKEHIAVVDFKGSIDGQPISEISSEAASISEGSGQWLKLDSDNFLPGFNEGLIGKNKGDKANINSTFSEEFPYKDLAGKEGQFEVEVKEIKLTKLPEVDDEFAKGFEAESLESLKEGIKKDLEAEADNKYKKELRAILVQKVTEKADFEIPQSMADETTKRMVYDIVYQNQQAGISKEQIEENTDEIYANANQSAIQRVRNSLILQSIGRKEDVQVNNEELSAYVSQMAVTYNIKPEKLIKDLKERDAFPEIVNNISMAKTIDIIQMHAKITEISKTKKELSDQPTKE